MKCKRNRVYRQQLCFFWFVLSPPNFGRFFWKHMWASYLHSYSPIMSWLLRLAYACMRVHAGRRPTQNLPRFLCMASFDQSGSFSLFRNQYSSLWNLGLCVVSRLVRSQDSKIATSVLFPLGHFLFLDIYLHLDIFLLGHLPSLGHLPHIYTAFTLPIHRNAERCQA